MAPGGDDRRLRRLRPVPGEKLPGEYPVSAWADCDAALDAAVEAAEALRAAPPERIAAFLEAFARRIEARKAELVETAHAETGLPRTPRHRAAPLPDEPRGRRAPRRGPPHRGHRLHRQPRGRPQAEGGRRRRGEADLPRAVRGEPRGRPPGALAERGEALVDEFVASSLLGTGQFCTNPSLVLLVAGEASEAFVAGVRARFEAATPTPLLSAGVARALAESVDTLQSAGATLVTGGRPAERAGYCFGNTLLRASGDAFLAAPGKLQTEAFGNAALFVVARDFAQLEAIVRQLEGSLTGSFYTDTRGSDDPLHDRLEPVLRPRVGRLLNDKMPTGVAVSPAMNHGGPYRRDRVDCAFGSDREGCHER